MTRRFSDRKLIQWAAAYLAGAWLVLQVVDIIGDKFAWPLGVQQGIIILLAFGLPVTLVLAWFHGEKGRQRLGSLELLVIAVILAAAGTVLAFGSRGPPTTAEGAGPVSRLTDTARPAVAVLPFASETSDPEGESFARGMHSDLLTQLSKIQALTVISATSVAQYSGTTKSIPAIGRELSVDAILEGTVQRAGDRVRVNVQLVDARADAHLWAETYDRPLTVTEIFAIQGEIARLVARSLAAELTPGEESRVARQSTDDLGAYDFFVRAQTLLDSRGLANHREAVRLLRQAVHLDSAFAPAWGSLAGAYALGILRHADEETWADTAEAYADHALEVDPEDAEAYRALGLVSIIRGQEQSALEFSLRSVELEPSSQAAVNNVGVTYHDVGRFAEALRWIRRSIRLAPTVTFLRTNIAGLYIHLRDFDMARERLREIVRLTPESADITDQLISLYRASGEVDSLLAAARANLDLNPGDPAAHHALASAALDALDYRLAREQSDATQRLAPQLSYRDEDTHFADVIRGYVLQREGEDGSARELYGRTRERLRTLLERQADSPWIFWELGSIHAALGENEAALDQLEQAVDAGFREVGWARLDPLLEGLRDEPRFEALLVRIEADLTAMRTRVAREEIAAGLRTGER